MSPGSSIQWSSDFSVTNAGFTICASDLPVSGRRLEGGTHAQEHDQKAAVVPSTVPAAAKQPPSVQALLKQLVTRVAARSPEMTKQLARVAAAAPEPKASRRRMQWGGDAELGYYFTLLGLCVEFDFGPFNSGGCGYWNDLDGIEDDCQEVSENEDDYPDNIVKLCNLYRFGTPLTVLLVISMLLLIAKFICGVVRCCVGCCTSVCINVTNVILSCFIALFMMLVAIIFGAACYPDVFTDDPPVGIDVEEGFGPGFWCTLFGGLLMCTSAVLSLFECCLKQGEPQQPPPAAGPTVVSGTAMATPVPTAVAVMTHSTSSAATDSKV